jgi:hypothetical protein
MRCARQSAIIRSSTKCEAVYEKSDSVGTEENEPIPREWLEEFEAAARRPLGQRLKYAFIKTYKPVMDDAPYRVFDTMADYRRWYEENLPNWLGYGRV